MFKCLLAETEPSQVQHYLLYSKKPTQTHTRIPIWTHMQPGLTFGRPPAQRRLVVGCRNEGNQGLLWGTWPARSSRIVGGRCFTLSETNLLYKERYSSLPCSLHVSLPVCKWIGGKHPRTNRFQG
jgi:hypothetical protein